MSRFQTWQDYCYPPPHDHVLRNKFGLQSQHELRRVEARAVAARQYELNTGRVTIPPTYDATHLSALHKHLFQDVYEWAGHTRTVGMVKAGSREFATLDEIPRYLEDAHRIITQHDWPTLSRVAITDGAAEVLAYVNQAHPFREGNGRTAKALLDQVLEQTAYELDYSTIPRRAWNLASEESRPATGQYRPDPTPLRTALEAATRARTGTPAAVEGHQRRVDELRWIMKAAFQEPGSPLPAPHHDRDQVRPQPGPMIGR